MRDRRGMSAVEFAMILPALLLIYIGIAEIGNALTIYRRTSTVASTAADLTAQVKSVSTSDLQDIVSAASSILTPYSADPLKLVVSSVVADNNNNGKVAWSYANKGAARSVNSSYAVPAGLTESGSSVIVAEMTYDFTPLLNLTSFYSPGAFEMKRTFYARPRRSLTVTKTN
jgi:Flp pilus assembly protein TadG